MTSAEQEIFILGKRDGINDCSSDIEEVLPPEVWRRACEEVLSAGYADIWTVCMVAIEELVEFWREEH